MSVEMDHGLSIKQNSLKKAGISATYLICNKCYSAPDNDSNEWQITPKATKSAIDWYLGAGYSVRQSNLKSDLTLFYVTAGTMNWQLPNYNNYAAF